MPHSRAQVKRLQAIFVGWLIAFWTASAFAASDTFIHGVESIPTGAVAIAMVLAMIGGAAYTSQKIAAIDVVVKSIPAEIIKDVLTSLVAGLCMFFAGAWREWPLFPHCILITVGGYGGSRVLEPMLDIVINAIKNFGTGGTKP